MTTPHGERTEALVTSNAPGLGDLIPRPDPTLLTASAVAQAKDDLRRELVTLRELLGERIARLEKIISDLDQRFSAEIGRRIDSAYAVLAQRDDGIEAELHVYAKAVTDAPDIHEALRERLQTDIATAIESLRELHEERFAGIHRQFGERDTRAEQDKRASRDALDAALLAQKDAVAAQNSANTAAATKSEAAFTKQIDQIGVLMVTLEKSITDRITELKERIDRGEGSTTGSAEQRAERRLDRTEGISSVVAVVMSISVIISIISVILVVVLHK